MNKHKHHIIPKYRCKELGIDPDFDENFVMVERIDHALIHWGYKCDDLEPLFKYVIPPQWIIDLIPRGDNRDIGAAVITARGEIDEIDMSGENHPSYKHGDYAGLHVDGWFNWPEEKKERRRALQRTPEYKEKFRIRENKPERMEYKRAYDRKRSATPERKAYKKKYDAERRAREKAETQGVNTKYNSSDFS